MDVNGLAKYNEDTDSLDVYYTDGELAGSIYCGFQYPIGKETNFAYTGSIQEFTIPANGLWKMEVYGAAGGSTSAGGYTGTGGKGGYSVGYIELNKDDIIYICVGGAGLVAWQNQIVNGGYNGGGTAGCDNYANRAAGSGGGATHIAKKTGTLKELGNSNLSSIYIIAGGGGGASASGECGGSTGGTGGGETGGSGGSGGGGTQTTAGSYNTNGGTAGGFGYGSNGNKASTAQCGGGGGLYGGGCSFYNGAAGGGSGYIGGVPSVVFKNEQYTPTTSNGVNSGDGSAKLTFIGK